MRAYPSLCIKVMYTAFILLSHPHKYQLIIRFYYISKINRDHKIDNQKKELPSAAATSMIFKGGCHRLKLQKVIMLSSRQPHWLYVSRATVFKRLHPKSMACSDMIVVGFTWQLAPCRIPINRFSTPTSSLSCSPPLSRTSNHRHPHPVSMPTVRWGIPRKDAHTSPALAATLTVIWNPPLLLDPDVGVKLHALANATKSPN
jgi:hypothetical protein